MEHLEATSRWLAGLTHGVELGPFKSPIPGINPLYVDCFAEYAHERCLRDYAGSAVDIPFRDSSLEYIASSHVLEHVANPIRAFAEWGRVLVHGGIIYAVIPDMRFTWDRNRPLTTAEHLLQDYQSGIDQTDGTHIDEFVDGIVWEEFSPGGSAEAREAFRDTLKGASRAGAEINIHFHTFCADQFPGVISAVNDAGVLPFHLALETVVERFPTSCPNGFLAVMKVTRTPLRKRVASWRRSLQPRTDPAKLAKPGVMRLPR